MHFELGRTDVYDDREAGMNYTVGNFAVDRCVHDHAVCDSNVMTLFVLSPRLPIGFFSLITVGQFVSGSMRLSLYNAVTTGTLVTSAGTIDFSFYTSARHACLLY